MAHNWLTERMLVRMAFLAVAYFVAGRLGLLLAIPPGYATAIWPAAGIALAAVLLYGNRVWPGVLIGSFFVNVATSFDGTTVYTVFKSLVLAASVGLGASLQALLGRHLIRRFVAFDLGMTSARSVLSVLGLGGPLSCLTSASWGVTTLWLFGLVSKSEFPYSWMTWWVGDTIGVVVVVPLVMIWLAEPRDIWRRRRVRVTLPLMLTLAAVVAAFVMASDQERRRIEVEYERQSIIIGDSLEKRLASYLEVVHSVQSFVLTAGKLNHRKFRKFVGRTLQRNPGIQALSWNPRVTQDQRAALEEALRQEGLRGFQFTQRRADGQLVRAGARPTYVVVQYIEPYHGNEKALGYDVYSNPVRRVALDMARDSGELVATARTTLVQETGNQAGVLVFLPVYRGYSVPAGTERRRRDLLGYVVGVFRMGDVLAAAFEGLGARGVEARLSDESASGPERQLAAFRVDTSGRSRLLTTDVGPAQTAGLTWSAKYPMGGRTWRLLLTPVAGYVNEQRSWAAWSVLVSGLVFAALLGAFLLILTGRAIVDERRVDDLARLNATLSDEVTQREVAERALHAEKERAETTLHSIGDAVVTTDAEGRVQFMNPVAERLTEWSTKEVRGRPLVAVFHVIHEETREPVVDPVRRCREEGRIIGLANHTVLISRSGREYAIQDSAAPIRDRDGRMLGIVLVFKDITESRRMAREAAYHASHDSLTNLVNRREFSQRLEQALASTKQYRRTSALGYLDLDQFKIVNDVAGHRAGDELLKQIAALLKSGVRERDTVARLGGDEFGMLLDNCPVDKATEIAATLVAAVRDHKFVWEGRAFDVGVSIGLVPIAGQVETAQELLTQADVACYAAKDSGRNRVHLYQSDSEGADPRHREILRVADMRSAVERNRFRLYCQPIFSLAEPDPIPARYELLVRLLDDQDEVVPPGGFIPAAERYGIMNTIDRWVILTAFRDMHELFPGRKDTPIAINLSGNSLNDDDLLAFIEAGFSKYRISPTQICFEVTETAAIRNLSATAGVIKAIRELGGHFALDDFGAGLSSFSYLKNLPVDYLKIDGSLVRNISIDASDRAIVEAINGAARCLGIKTIAEYAESQATLGVLRDLKLDYAQGNALGCPVPLPLEVDGPRK
jgi:diguanylate cyclase (GGDEF)-like protein/PAS domain S-box-containing protein